MLKLDNNSLIRDQAYIDGEWRGAKGGARFPVRNPATHEVIAEVADLDEGDVREAIEAADRAFPSWRGKTAKDRAVILRKWYELMIMKSDGSEKKQLTSNGGANFAPYFHPNGRQIIFASNMQNPRGGNFDLFLINRDGSGLQQITFDENFDGFPMFNADGTKLIWESNRHARQQGETNVFIADWVN